MYPAAAALIPQPKPTIIWGIEDARQTSTRTAIRKLYARLPPVLTCICRISILSTAGVSERGRLHQPGSAPRRLVIPSNWSRLAKAITTSPAFRAFILMLTEVASVSDRASSSLTKSRDFSAFEAVLLPF